MRETLEEKPTDSVTLKPGLKSSVSTFSADNESGYEDCDPSEAHDTISEVNDPDPDLSDVTETRGKPLEADQEADSLIETTSALTIDSSTRSILILASFLTSEYKVLSFQATFSNLFCLIYIVITEEVSEQNSCENAFIKHNHIKL